MRKVNSPNGVKDLNLLQKDQKQMFNKTVRQNRSPQQN